MSNALIIEIRGAGIADDVNAPLSEDELARVEKFIDDYRAGDFGTTSDPAERDREAAGKSTVWAYRKALVEA